MSHWRRLPFTLLALWALLLTFTPQMVWSCPTTGRVDVATRVCSREMAREMAQVQAATEAATPGEMPCAGSGNKCCKPLQVPASQSDNAQHTQFVAAADSVSFAPVFVAGALPIVAILPTLEAAPSPALRLYLRRFNNSPPPFWTQFRSLSLSGRAPPVL